jgi:hypothetical protein
VIKPQAGYLVWHLGPTKPLHRVRCHQHTLTTGLMVHHSAHDFPNWRPRRPGRCLRPAAGQAGGASATAAAAEHGPRQHRQHSHVRGQPAASIRPGEGSPLAALMLLHFRPGIVPIHPPSVRLCPATGFITSSRRQPSRIRQPAVRITHQLPCSLRPRTAQARAPSRRRPTSRRCCGRGRAI